MKTAFIGHRKLFSKDIRERLTNEIKAEIENGCTAFTMGTHGDFDKLALNCCRQLKHTYPNIEIEVVITSLNTIKKDKILGDYSYADVKTLMYEIEDAHFKQQITLSNRQMISTCTTLICYVDTSRYRSGAKTTLRYAEKRGLKIVNLYRKEDNPFYGMTEEQKKEYLQSLSIKK